MSGTDAATVAAGIAPVYGPLPRRNSGANWFVSNNTFACYRKNAQIGVTNKSPVVGSTVDATNSCKPAMPAQASRITSARPPPATPRSPASAEPDASRRHRQNTSGGSSSPSTARRGTTVR